MRIVLDGLEYDTYPDNLERLARLRADRDRWAQLAAEQAREIGRLRRELDGR